MAIRKVPLAVNEIYHVFTKSISGFTVFNHLKDYERILSLLSFYNHIKPPCKFSLFLELQERIGSNILPLAESCEKLVKILVYCIMPTHIHLVLEQLHENGIAKFMNLILISYSKYFNAAHNRKGPLWEDRFQNVRVEDDSHFVHLTRYVHLNPTTADLVARPEEWRFSSYGEYLGTTDKNNSLCTFSDCLDIRSEDYKRFVDDRIEYQRELALIKYLLLD